MFIAMMDMFSLIGFAVAFGLLAKGMGKMAWQSCTTGWGKEEGNGPFICRTYKAGYAFALISL